MSEKSVKEAKSYPIAGTLIIIIMVIVAIYIGSYFGSR